MALPKAKAQVAKGGPNSSGPAQAAPAKAAVAKAGPNSSGQSQAAVAKASPATVGPNSSGEKRPFFPGDVQSEGAIMPLRLLTGRVVDVAMQSMIANGKNVLQGYLVSGRTLDQVIQFQVWEPRQGLVSTLVQGACVEIQGGRLMAVRKEQKVFHMDRKNFMVKLQATSPVQPVEDNAGWLHYVPPTPLGKLKILAAGGSMVSLVGKVVDVSPEKTYKGGAGGQVVFVELRRGGEAVKVAFFAADREKATSLAPGTCVYMSSLRVSAARTVGAQCELRAVKETLVRPLEDCKDADLLEEVQNTPDVQDGAVAVTSMSGGGGAERDADWVDLGWLNSMMSQPRKWEEEFQVANVFVEVLSAEVTYQSCSACRKKWQEGGCACGKGSEQKRLRAELLLSDLHGEVTATAFSSLDEMLEELEIQVTQDFVDNLDAKQLLEHTGAVPWTVRIWLSADARDEAAKRTKATLQKARLTVTPKPSTVCSPVVSIPPLTDMCLWPVKLDQVVYCVDVGMTLLREQEVPVEKLRVLGTLTEPPVGVKRGEVVYTVRRQFTCHFSKVVATLVYDGDAVGSVTFSRLEKGTLLHVLGSMGPDNTLRMSVYWVVPDKYQESMRRMFQQEMKQSAMEKLADVGTLDATPMTKRDKLRASVGSTQSKASMQSEHELEDD